MKSRSFIYIVALGLCLGACSSHKSSLAYFSDIDPGMAAAVATTRNEVRIMPDDELYIAVNSVDPEAALPYNVTAPVVADRKNLEENYQRQQTLSYIVDGRGNITMPMIGQLHVEGMTVDSLTQVISERVSRDVVDPIVRVELLNFKVNVLGEVHKAGQFTVHQRDLSVLEALALAGDLTEYGERSKVVVIRNENGKAVYHTLDLSRSDVVSSPYFYLQQNDVVYVTPNKIREANSKYNQHNSYKLSLTSTIVSACSVLASVIIALTLK